LLADDHNNEQNQDDVVSSNNQQDMSVNENAIQVNGTNICNQSVPKENIRITNTDCSSVNYNANINPGAQQTNCTLINVDDDDSNTDLLDEGEEICPICQDRLGTEIELGKMICSCTDRFHYRCLKQYTRRNPEYNPFLNNRIICVTYNGVAARIERITRNRHDDDDSNADLLDEDEEICPIYQDRLGTEIELGKMICSCTARFHYRCLVQCMRCDLEYNPFLNNGIKCVTCNGIAAGIKRITRNRH
jgi:hypothetical protein